MPLPLRQHASELSFHFRQRAQFQRAMKLAGDGPRADAQFAGELALGQARLHIEAVDAVMLQGANTEANTLLAQHDAAVVEQGESNHVDVTCLVAARRKETVEHFTNTACCEIGIDVGTNAGAFIIVVEQP